MGRRPMSSSKNEICRKVDRALYLDLYLLIYFWNPNFDFYMAVFTMNNYNFKFCVLFLRPISCSYNNRMTINKLHMNLVGIELFNFLLSNSSFHFTKHEYLIVLILNFISTERYEDMIAVTILI